MDNRLIARTGSWRFQPLSGEDIPMLHEWLTRPHLVGWWGHTESVQDTYRYYFPRTLDTSSIHPYVAYQSGDPIGFIQSYVVADVGDGWWPGETDLGIIGIDQFLADSAHMNQGRGTAMVRAFVELLFQDPCVMRIQADPKPANARAVRCYEKADFRRVREVETPDGRALLMVRDRGQVAAGMSPSRPAE